MKEESEKLEQEKSDLESEVSDVMCVQLYR